METITGSAAGVPFTALPPVGAPDGPAPLVVTWHMLDAPRTDAAFAAALPMAEVPAWRVHLGMPLCGARMVDGSLDAHVERAREDALLAYLGPVVRQAADEFPAALAALRDQLPLDDGPIGVVGGSVGGTVALRVAVEAPAPIGPVALVNAAIRGRTAVDAVSALLGQDYGWTDEARATAGELDFVARAGELAARQPAVLVVNGEQDIPVSRADADALVGALRERYTRPDDVEHVVVPDLAHALTDEPGMEPAPQWPATAVVDQHLNRWFRRHLAP